LKNLATLGMELNSGIYAGGLRSELILRNRLWAKGRAHVESYGSAPVIVYEPEGGLHGNFYDPAYAAILKNPLWSRRFDKIHAQGRSLPKCLPTSSGEQARRWRELDSSMSSDALLMNIFCTPAVQHSAAIRLALGVDLHGEPEFGWKARVPLANGRVDRTEVDMRWGGLLIEAKLTESDFQTRAASIVESYRDFDAVFDRDSLPQTVLKGVRRRTAREFPEEFSQEPEEAVDPANLPFAAIIAEAHQSAIAARAWESAPGEPAYGGYQLIRNVLAAHAEGCSFCVLHDARRPDLREAWFRIMAALKSADLRARCKVLTWQELAALFPADLAPLSAFLDSKYGIVKPGGQPTIPGDSILGHLL
jgi:hypothetical protein